MKQPEWDLAKSIEELTIEHGVNLTEIINVALDLLNKESENNERA